MLAAVWLCWVYYHAIATTRYSDPVEEVLHFTGTGAINLLLLSLTISPLIRRFRLSPLFALRRPLGLWALAYGLTHVVSFILFELQLDWQQLLDALISRPYIIVGFIALLLLSAMGVTSTRGWQRRLGPRWQRLHNSVYVAAPLVLLHYLWSLKTIGLEPLLYCCALLLLMLLRRQQWQRWWRRAMP